MSPRAAFFALLLGWALSQTSCTRSPTHLANKPVVKVNDRELKVKRFADLLGRKIRNLPSLIAKDPHYLNKVKEEIVAQFISESLIENWAESNKVGISNKSLDEEISLLRQDYPDDFSFRKTLATEGLAFSEWRDQVRHRMLEKEFFNQLRAQLTKPTEQEISNYYNNNKARFQRKERLQIRQIVVSDQIQAETLLSELKKTPMNILAKKYSLAPEAHEEGLTDWIEIGSVPEFDPLFKAPIGTPQILKSPAGYHLARVEKKLPAGYLSLDSVRSSIAKEVLANREQAEFLAWTDRQLRVTRVWKDSTLISSIKVETQ